MGSLTMWFPPSVNLLSLSAPAATVKYHRLSSLETTGIHFSQFWRPGRPGSQCELTCCLAHFLVHSQHLLAVSSQNGREVSKVSEGSSTKALIAFMRIPASWLHLAPIISQRPSSPNTFTLRVRTYEFGEDRNTESITLGKIAPAKIWVLTMHWVRFYKKGNRT